MPTRRSQRMGFFRGPETAASTGGKLLREDSRMVNRPILEAICASDFSPASAQQLLKTAAPEIGTAGALAPGNCQCDVQALWCRAGACAAYCRHRRDERCRDER